MIHPSTLTVGQVTGIISGSLSVRKCSHQSIPCHRCNKAFLAIFTIVAATFPLLVAFILVGAIANRRLSAITWSVVGKALHETSLPIPLRSDTVQTKIRIPASRSHHHRDHFRGLPTTRRPLLHSPAVHLSGAVRPRRHSSRLFIRARSQLLRSDDSSTNAPAPIPQMSAKQPEMS